MTAGAMGSLGSAVVGSGGAVVGAAGGSAEGAVVGVRAPGEGVGGAVVGSVPADDTCGRSASRRGSM